MKPHHKNPLPQKKLGGLSLVSAMTQISSLPNSLTLAGLGEWVNKLKSLITLELSQALGKRTE